MRQNIVDKLVIPAAGLGTRFLPLTKAQPKEMLPVVDKPVIQYVVEEAVVSGIDDILIITGRNKRAIEDHFDKSFELEYNLKENRNVTQFALSERISNLAEIHFIRQKEPRGLGDAVLCAKKHCNDQPFAVLLGDTITVPDVGCASCTTQMISAFSDYGCPVIVVEKVRREKIRDYGIIGGPEIAEGVYEINTFIEKPTLDTAPSDLGAIGRYVLTPDIFDILSDLSPGLSGEVQLTDALQQLPRKIGLVSHCRRYDIGDKLGWMKANLALTLQNKEFGGEIREYFRSLEAGEQP
ncbi:MAG: UTP--glucose-1-phosphate uridylyltransferase AglF [Euryarchaeota archaeon ADurb.Bin294]|nr:MAG: UTP--glucose-1-phosphate uridylyltransferase AglF [Euryarchaeota archaeon ADurb.Bin294]HOW33227.1 UTP--glucose-1-phosphate uridylyltransferase GalU [Methanoregulaceae archaeon]